MPTVSDHEFPHLFFGGSLDGKRLSFSGRQHRPITIVVRTHVDGNQMQEELYERQQAKDGIAEDSFVLLRSVLIDLGTS